MTYRKQYPPTFNPYCYDQQSPLPGAKQVNACITSTTGSAEFEMYALVSQVRC